jgi:hypothetical protein
MMEPLSELRVELLSDPDTDAEQMADLSGRLRIELLDLDVSAVEPATGGGEVPADAKGIGLLAAGGLVVRFASPEVLQSLVSGIWSWLGRQHHRSIKLTLDGDSIELAGVSSAEQERLIDLWVNRHAGAY